MLKEEIEQKLEHALSPYFLEIINESSQHNVPAGSETHFKATIVSEKFQGQSLVERQKGVYQLLQNEFQKGLHALALHTWTPAEWEKKGGKIPSSPPCLGGSKR